MAVTALSANATHIYPDDGQGDDNTGSLRRYDFADEDQSQKNEIINETDKL